MTDNEILKALECCSIGTFACGKGCPCYSVKSNLKVSSCRFELMRELSDLVNRQKAEIERLKKEISITREYIHSHNLEWDLLSYYNRKEQAQNE